MRANLILGALNDPGLAVEVALQAEALMARGDHVRVYVDSDEEQIPMPPSIAVIPWADRAEDWCVADFFIVDVASPALRNVEEIVHGFVLLLCSSGEVVPWIHYADACLIHDLKLYNQLHRWLGVPLERILFLPAPLDSRDYEAYAAAFSGLVLLAFSDALPRAAKPSTTVSSSDLRSPAGEVTEEAELLRERADVMLRGYTVRSRVPLIGGIIAWFRRMLTSHLREPYLDPTLERQVTLNRDLIETLIEMQMTQKSLSNRLTTVERALKAQQACLEYDTSEGEPNANH